ncbi:protein LAZ1 homolog 2-like isoform X2 [Andrographis paniculata]|uniref:protein LAZ1 homolog 2-like isoform X2 n=1 Tax=Andrographis paniculata TaxID=175694 RepID=UPI0021E7CCC4|nr:protein LAZ1 homolog 2-like isoform X2 [Andrographis paniculata]
MASAFPYLFLHQSIYEDLHLPAVIVAACFVFVALVLSLLLTSQHLRSYTKPSWIVAVIFMVPVYATESILSLWNANLSTACDILRNCYEAFALYAFGSYLIACLGGEAAVVDFLEDKARNEISQPLLEGEKNHQKNPQSEHTTFFNFIFRPCLLGKDLFTIIKFGLVQYMILKTLCALLAFILELGGVYGDGEFKWYYGYPYITIVLNFSQMWALYCLVQFYGVTHQRLEPIKPLAKFISFKAIVFATWWQGVAIVLFCTFGVLPKDGKFQTGLQDLLICIEMAIAAVAHIFVFSARPYHYVPARVTTEETTAVLMTGEDNKKKPALLEKKETEVEAPGTSVRESVHDIVVGGGQKVVKDVVLTINQAIEPVHEGMTKIQETFHHTSVANDATNEPEVTIEEHQQSIAREPEA